MGTPPKKGALSTGEQGSQEGDSIVIHISGGNMASNHDKDSNNKGDTSNRGFASMDEDKQREIASKGGTAAHERGTAHEFDSEEAREAGRKGGDAVSQDRQHMSEIGRKGGENSHGASREQHAKAGSQSQKNEGSSSGSDSHSRGGSSDQHSEAGRQSHKNR
jgi:general stress protein YciG